MSKFDALRIDQGENTMHAAAPMWQQQLNEINRNEGLHNPDAEHIKDMYFSREEVGIKHPTNESLIKITDEGYLDFFADDQVGIRIDPITKSVNIFGDSVNFFAKNMNFKTNPNGLIWNGYYFNPELYYEDEKERAQVITGHKEYYHHNHEEVPTLQWHRDPWEIRPMMRSNTRFRYSQGMIAIMEQMGLPVYESE